MFSTANVEERASLTHGLHIDYILVGPHERARYPGVEARFEADPSHLEEAYAAGGVKMCWRADLRFNTETAIAVRIQRLMVTRGQSEDHFCVHGDAPGSALRQDPRMCALQEPTRASYALE